MDVNNKVERLLVHQNGLGFLRLLFASLVIVSHSAEIAFGNRSHEPLTMLFGTVSFGTLAVYCFFIISGYLIVGSYAKQPKVWPYLRKRIIRIYPAFVVSSLLCSLIAVPLAGGAVPSTGSGLVSVIVRIALLQPPNASGAFAGTFYPAVNGSMWSIAYEARCYLLVLALGGLGLLARRGVIVTAAALLLCAPIVFPERMWTSLDGLHGFSAVAGVPSTMVQLTGLFLAGASYYLWRDRVTFSTQAIAAAVCGLIACMSLPLLVVPGVAILGSYLIFAFAGSARGGVLHAINNKDDISYGVYLYAWPIGKLLFWYLPSLPVALNCVLTFGLSCLCGWLSWHWLEKPVMARIVQRRPRSSEQLALSA